MKRKRQLLDHYQTISEKCLNFDYFKAIIYFEIKSKLIFCGIIGLAIISFHSFQSPRYFSAT